MPAHEKLNYVEFASRDLTATKAFLTQALGWAFVDFGPDYAAFAGEGLDGGFYTSTEVASCAQGCALLVFYSANLERTLEKITSCGATLSKPIFSFPGGRRFHFVEPGGNELAVWSDLDPK